MPSDCNETGGGAKKGKNHTCVVGGDVGQVEHNGKTAKKGERNQKKA